MLLLLVKPHWLNFLRSTPLDIFPCSCRVGGRAKRWSGPAGSAHSAAQSLVTGWMNSARSDLMSIPCSVCVCVCVRVCTAANKTWHCNLQDKLTHACVCLPLALPACLSAALWCELADMKEPSEKRLLLWPRDGWQATVKGGWMAVATMLHGFPQTRARRQIVISPIPLHPFAFMSAMEMFGSFGSVLTCEPMINSPSLMMTLGKAVYFPVIYCGCSHKETFSA